MTPEAAQHLITSSLLVTGVLVVVRDVSDGHAPQVRTGLGLIVGGVLLAALSGPAPDIAGGLAVLAATTSLLTIGVQAFGDINKGLGVT